MSNRKYAFRIRRPIQKRLKTSVPSSSVQSSEIFGFSAMVPFADRREHCEVALPKVAEHQLERHD